MARFNIVTQFSWRYFWSSRRALNEISLKRSSWKSFFWYISFARMAPHWMSLDVWLQRGWQQYDRFTMEWAITAVKSGTRTHLSAKLDTVHFSSYLLIQATDITYQMLQNGIVKLGSITLTRTDRGGQPPWHTTRLYLMKWILRLVQANQVVPSHPTQFEAAENDGNDVFS